MKTNKQTESTTQATRRETGTGNPGICLGFRLALLVMAGLVFVFHDITAQASLPPGFVHVQGGTYIMGDLEPNDDYNTRKTSRRVTVGSFAISTTHVTADFSANGYRLPTDAEWEYAAKGGPASSRLSVKDIYAGSSDIDAVAWYEGNSGGRSRPVATKRPNALGLYDMSGNALQWCHDWSHSGKWEQDVVDPVGDEGPPVKILRGGSWSMAAFDCRSGMHHGDDAYNYSDDKGFRLVFRPGN